VGLLQKIGVAPDLGGEALIGALDLAEPAFAQDQLALAEVGPVDQEDLDPRSVEEAGGQVRCLQRVFIEEPLDIEIVDRKIGARFHGARQEAGCRQIRYALDDGETITIHIPTTFRKRGGRKLVVTPDGAAWAPRPRVDNAMVKALAGAFRWRRMLDEGVHATLEDLARANGVHATYVSRVLRLTLLAPDIVETILDGRQPAELQLDDLLEGSRWSGDYSSPTSADGAVRPSGCGGGWRPRSFAALPLRPSSLPYAGRRCPMRCTLLSLIAISLVITGLALAQEAADGRRPSHCVAFVESTPGFEVIRAAASDEARAVDYRSRVPPETVRISYIDHSMFLIQTPGGLSVVTDYNGFIGRAELIPDVVTMNHAHGTHWTAAPDPRIPHVLRGWNPDGDGPAEHRLDLGEMLVRNVPTDIRGLFGGPPEAFGNSIFVFEVEGLCIGHLGHLHHTPTPEQYAAIGRLDVVMAPVDGGLTLPLPEMIALLKHVRSAIVIPMHWSSMGSLQHFLAGMEDQFRVDVRDETFVDVSLRGLPPQPRIMVMPPRLLGVEAR
jgi:L-ascorbate metabolism protein UlaG (beta-lactamase superfamily)